MQFKLISKSKALLWLQQPTMFLLNVPLALTFICLWHFIFPYIIQKSTAGKDTKKEKPKTLFAEAECCWPDERILCLSIPVRISGLQTGHVRLLPNPFHFINQHVLRTPHELRQRQHHKACNKSSNILHYCSQKQY
jgi:hypothetical protein